MPRRILLIDTEPKVAMRLEQCLLEEGYSVWNVSGEQPHCEAAVRSYSCDLVLFDTEIVRTTPTLWMRWMRQFHPYTPFVAMNRKRTVAAAIAWMRTGVLDYVEKPLRKDRLSSWCQQWMVRRAEKTDDDFAGDFPLPCIHLTSPAMKTLREQAYFWSQRDVPVVLVGEEGTEKESIAAWMHKQSTRCDKPWQRISWSSLLLQQRQGKTAWRRWCQEHEEGAVWVEMDTRSARNFLFQPCGIWVPGIRWYVGISTQTLQLPGEVAQIRIPSLRERPEDAVTWALYWVQDWAKERGKPSPQLTKQARQWLLTQPWPGNTNQLQSVVQQVLARMPEGSLEEYQFAAFGAPSRPFACMALNDLEQQALLRTLRLFDGNKTAAAKTLGISRRTLYNKLAFYKMR